MMIMVANSGQGSDVVARVTANYLPTDLRFLWDEPTLWTQQQHFQTEIPQHFMTLQCKITFIMQSPYEFNAMSFDTYFLSFILANPVLYSSHRRILVFQSLPSQDSKRALGAVNVHESLPVMKSSQKETVVSAQLWFSHTSRLYCTTLSTGGEVSPSQSEKWPGANRQDILRNMALFQQAKPVTMHHPKRAPT